MSFLVLFRRVTNFKGRHLGFLALLCVGWATARFVIVGREGAYPEYQIQAIATQPVADVARVAQPITATQMRDPDRSCCLQALRLNHPDKPAARRDLNRTTVGPFLPEDVTRMVASGFERSAVPEKPTSMSGDASPNVSFQPLPSSRRILRADAYAYNFWRAGNGRSGLAAGGQYGGSQSGVIATFSLQSVNDPDQPQILALLVRAAVAHDNIDEREVALGVRWRPLEKLPVTITAERRFRHDRADAFSVYAAGGASDVKLPLKFRVDSFAQAGIVSGKQAGPFFDAFVRADRNMIGVDGMQLHAGAGAWAGGQRNAARLDIGPSLRTDVHIRDARVRINVDWRFRVAGDATPGNGPALTLSTGF